MFFKKMLTKRTIIFFVILIGIIFLTLFFFKKDENNTINSYGEIPQGLGVSIHRGISEEDIQAIADAGFKWVRIDIFWSSVEKTKGKYNFKSTGYDELNEQIIAKGLKPYYILDYGNSLYGNERSVVTNKARKAFIKFAETTVKRYGGQNGVWEIWNEPNHGNFWEVKPSYGHYARLVEAVAPIIRKYDKSSLIVAPALSGLSDPSLQWLKQIKKQGTFKYIDAISVHPYQEGKPEDVISQYKKLKKIAKNKPVFSGEWGYSVTDLDEIKQAEFLARSLLINNYAGIPISIWYDWKNDGQEKLNREHNFGLVSYYSTPKFSYLAVQTLTSQLKSYRYSKRIKVNNTNDYILEFRNADKDKILVFWTTKSSHSVHIKLKNGRGRLVSMLGAKRSVKWDDYIEVNMQTSPNYLIIK
ncbi:glycoside hydrolase family 5 protein [Priestia megaterium]|uniref:cellulase family glycosylhydrolase n=1 Tax=Priestia megaterium TaxID=1404 RepID=UPI002281B43C|nr:cellulase family glycosylhydrolase [Priestia megaterium]MCY9018883.1 glycoside hydrolase family 5 protein [Priestia megaterium]